MLEQAEHGRWPIVYRELDFSKRVRIPRDCESRPWCHPQPFGASGIFFGKQPQPRPVLQASTAGGLFRQTSRRLSPPLLRRPQMVEE